MGKSYASALSILNKAIKNGTNVTKEAEKAGFGSSYIGGVLRNIESRKDRGSISKEEYNAFMNVYDDYARSEGAGKSIVKRLERKTKSAVDSYAVRQSNPLNLKNEEVNDLEYNADADDAYDERSKGDIIRGKESFKDRHGMKLKRITGYKYKILIHGEKPLEGSFAREQMDAVYRLYSGMDGAGMTLRAVAREFPDLSYRDFKRILRAFNITKSSLPVSPHIMEEMSEDEIVSQIRRNKEHSVLKKLDDDRSHHYEKRLLQTQREILDIKAEAYWVEEVISKFFDQGKYKELLRSTAPKKAVKERTNKTKSSKKSEAEKVGKPVMCVFGDIHFGKKFDSPIFGRGYNKDIAHERIMKIAEEAVAEVSRKNSSELIMLSMGDLIESSLEEGIHAGHYAEMDLHQSEQIFFATESIIKMIEYVICNTNAKITFASIHGNHDRMAMGRDEDKSRTGGQLVSGFVKRIIDLKYPNKVEFLIPENNLFRLVKGNLCIFAQHGDSALSKKRPAELMTLFGEGNEYYHTFFKGHWHYLKAEEGTNSLAIQVPAVASTDRYILEEVGSNCLPGFIIGSEPEMGRGFDYKKITLY